MNKKIISLFVFIGLLSAAFFVSAQTIPNPLGSTSTFCALLGNIATAVGTVIASLATIMIIVAGIMFLTSAGDAGRMETAKKALIYAIIGIVIGLAASILPGIIINILGSSGTTC